MNESTRISKSWINKETDSKVLTEMARELALRGYYLVVNRRGSFEELTYRSNYMSIQERWEMVNDKLGGTSDWGDQIA